jgi:membrane-bound ClpP family serine protease
VKEKDRYLRQILIGDIEAITGRPLAVYFSQLDQEINHTDPDDLSEILLGIKHTEVDLLIQTPGGNIDATEKIISILNYRFKHYRVIVPSWAKSAGTVIALSSNEIVLGVNSELGPIDPQMRTPQGYIPCEILANDPQQPFHIKQMCTLTIERNRKMAKDLLKKGMMNGKSDADIDDLVSKISTANSYKSHGAVINHDEANALGLAVRFLDYKDELWNRLWLLYCMYDYDSKAKNLGKIFEGRYFSISRPK